ncbi:MAG: hypothetical protein F6K19_19985 [Cyanothece sp. SIO1E1]|nr:hypothetical protein [Cyanothece sp. SIO1E1]
MYTYFNPPYFVLLAGLFIGVTSGLAFQGLLKQATQTWSEQRTARILNERKGMQLFVPFLGICSGIILFLASGLAVFGFATLPSYLVSIVMTFLSGLLIWVQLGKLLQQLEQGGSQALDLDSL